jgi:adenylate kinase
MKPVAILLFGPPGSGKSTQEMLLERNYSVIPFDTGRHFESIFRDPKRKKTKTLEREEKLFKSGELMTSSFVAREVIHAVKQIKKAGYGVVLSGSPRTAYEAEHLIPLLTKLYGRDEIVAVLLEVPEKTSTTRNGARYVCTECKAPLLTAYYPKVTPKVCPVCGGSLYRRSLDTPTAMIERLKEYKAKTMPVVALVESAGIPVHRVNAAPAPYKVFQAIEEQIKKSVGL